MFTDRYSSVSYYMVTEYTSFGNWCAGQVGCSSVHDIGLIQILYIFLKHHAYFHHSITI